MEYVVEQSVANEIDVYFKAAPSESGNWWSVKMPWNKNSRWIAADKYFKFRYDIAHLPRELATPTTESEQVG
jgi:hypothetical protein